MHDMYKIKGSFTQLKNQVDNVDLNKIKDSFSKVNKDDVKNVLYDRFDKFDQSLKRDKRDISDLYRNSDNRHISKGFSLQGFGFDKFKEKFNEIGERTKSAYNAFNNHKKDKIDQRNGRDEQPYYNEQHNSQVDHYTNTDNQLNKNHQLSNQKPFTTYLNNLRERAFGKKERTTYDIYLDNFSETGKQNYLKTNFFSRKYKAFKNKLFWNFVIFFSVLTFFYSFAKHLAMGRTMDKQMSTFLEMQKMMQQGGSNNKTNNT